MRLSTVMIVLAISVVLAALLALGTWQVQRLYWKEALIQRVSTRLAQAPVPVSEAMAEPDPLIREYAPVILSGEYLRSEPAFEFTTFKATSGWHVFAPFQLSAADAIEGRDLILVNRGFVPYDMRGSDDLLSNLPQGSQELTGLLRMPLAEKPGAFVNENDPAKRTFFWRDIVAMARATGLDTARLAGFYVDAGIPGQSSADGQYPVAGTTLVSFSNNHLQYVVTWYGLALALLGVGGYFLYARRKT